MLFIKKQTPDKGWQFELSVLHDGSLDLKIICTNDSPQFSKLCAFILTGVPNAAAQRLSDLHPHNPSEEIVAENEPSKNFSGDESSQQHHQIKFGVYSKKSHKLLKTLSLHQHEEHTQDILGHAYQSLENLVKQHLNTSLVEVTERTAEAYERSTSTMLHRHVLRKINEGKRPDFSKS